MSYPAPNALNELELFVVYESPADYPGQFVVRRWRIFAGSAKADQEPLSVSADYKQAVRELQHRGLCRMPRHPNDDPVIYEVWI